MGERNYSAGFGLPDPTPSPTIQPNGPLPLPSGIPGQTLADVKNTSQASPDQKAIANALGGPGSDIPDTINGRKIKDVLGAGNDTTTTDTSQPSTPPWYLTGNMPPDTNPMVVNALSQMSERKTPDFNPNTKQFNTYSGALQDELTKQQAYQQAHQERGKQLQEKHDELEALHAQNEEAHNNALNEHIYAKTLTPDAMFNQFKKEQETNVPKIESTPEVPLAKSPLGGLGTKKYAIEFGATPEEAQNVPSMSKMQKENIPRQASAFDVLAKEFPGMAVSQYENYPFLLAGTTGEDYLKEKMKPEYQDKLAQEKAAQEEQKIKDHLAEKLAEHKARTQFDYEVTKAEKEKSAQLLKDAKKELDTHYKFNPNEIRSQIEQEQKIQNYKNTLNSLRGRGKPVLGAANLGGGGFDEYTNTYATQGAGDLSYAHELTSGLANPKIDAKTRQIYMDELNKLQAKNPKLLPALQNYYNPNPAPKWGVRGSSWNE
jgi:hypothetical protein